MLHERAAHPRRRGAAATADRRSARRSTGSARRRCASGARRSTTRPARSGAGRPAARIGAAARPAARAQRLGAAGPARRRLSGAPHDLDPSAGAGRAWAPCRSTSRATRSRRRTGLTGASFYLDEASVTGTETALLAAAAATGRTEIRHAAMEPHVVELCRFLQRDGRRRSRARARRRSASRRRRASPARRIGSTATTSRRAAGASSRRSPAARSR